MPSYLLVAFPGRCSLFQVHALQQSIFAIAFTDFQDGLLSLAFFLELSLFLLLCTQGFILSTTLDYFDEMGLYAFSSAINLILIVTILIFNTLVNKLTGASLDDGIGGN